MILDRQTLRDFFEIFGKKISEEELEILKGGKNGELIKNQISKNFLKKAKSYAWLFKKIPFVKEVFVCNTVAFGTSDESSDIDLFVVTENGKIWTARIFSTLFLEIFGVRRKGKKIAGRFCLSFFATEKGALNLEKIQTQKDKDPYLALWTATLVPLIGDGDFLEKFRRENKWVENYGLKISFGNRPEKKLFKLLEKIFGASFVEKIFKKVFEKRSLAKKEKLKDQSGTVISSDYLKFHDKDKRKEIYSHLVKSNK